MNALAIHTVRAFALAAATSLTALAGHAQSSRPIGKVTIPFDFSMNGEQYHAGRYDFHLDGNIVTAFDGKRNFLALSRNDADTSNHKDARLVFHCYGKQCFLREIWQQNLNSHLSFPPNKAEAVARRGMLAQNGSGAGDDAVVAFQ